MRKNNKKFIINMIATSVIGLMVLMIVMFLSIRAYVNPSDKYNNINIKNAEEEKDSNIEYSHMMLVLVEKITEKNIIGYDIEHNEDINKQLSAGTKVNDTFGSVITYSQIKPGDLVELAYQEDTSKVISITKSARAKSWKKISGVAVDKVAKEINIGGTAYKYGENTLVIHSNGNPTNMDFVGPFDVVTVQALDDVIWSITIEQVAATLTLKDLPTLDGKLEIDRSRVINLNEINEPISLIAGQHKVLIQMKGYEIISENITAESGENYEFDLKGVQKAYTTINPLVASNIKDYTITIDNKTYKKGEQIKVQQGTYKIVATALGYEEWSKEIICDKENYNLYVSFVPIEVNDPNSQNTSNGTVNGQLNEALNNSHTITLSTDPAGAKVYIDGVNKGVTPYTVTLMNGTYSVLFEKDGYSVYSTSVILDNNNNQTNFLYVLTPIQ